MLATNPARQTQLCFARFVNIVNLHVKTDFDAFNNQGLVSKVGNIESSVLTLKGKFTSFAFTVSLIVWSGSRQLYSKPVGQVEQPNQPISENFLSFAAFLPSVRPASPGLAFLRIFFFKCERFSLKKIWEIVNPVMNQ